MFKTKGIVSSKKAFNVRYSTSLEQDGSIFSLTYGAIFFQASDINCNKRLILQGRGLLASFFFVLKIYLYAELKKS